MSSSPCGFSFNLYNSRKAVAQYKAGRSSSGLCLLRAELDSKRGRNMRRIEIGIILSFLVATSAAAQCTLDLKANQTGSQAVLSWNKVAGATSYIVEESADSFKTITRNALPDNAKVFTHRTSTTKKYSYRVTAANPSDPLFVGCTAVADVSYPADADLVKITNHHVIPFVGRTAGAGSALFK